MNYKIANGQVYSSDPSQGIRQLYIGEEQIWVEEKSYTFDVIEGYYKDDLGNALIEREVSDEIEPLVRVEEKLDFLLQKQVQRDLEETLKSLEVDLGV